LADEEDEDEVGLAAEDDDEDEGLGAEDEEEGLAAEDEEDMAGAGAVRWERVKGREADVEMRPRRARTKMRMSSGWTNKLGLEVWADGMENRGSGRNGCG
jgi:hypothetical protein